MKYRKLGKSGLEVSVIGLGTLAMGGGGYGPVDDRESITAIRRAIELGVNFIDTSDNYGLGHAEVVVGRAIRGVREKVVLATKGGTPWDNQGRVVIDCRKEVIIRAAEESLRRLGTDWIDLYQIHTPDPQVPFEETAEALQILIREGKVRHIGLSNFWMEEIKEWVSIDGIVSLQMPYNFLHRDIEEDLPPFCRDQEVGLISYTPLLMGMFAGRITQETRFDRDDHRSLYPQFQGDSLRQCLALTDQLRMVAQEWGMTLAQLALSWVISRPGITCAIPGAKHPNQVEENALAGKRMLTKGELGEIDRILDEVGIEAQRLMPMRVVKVEKGPRGAVGLLEGGLKLGVPNSVVPGDMVEVDIVKGKVVGLFRGSN